MTARILAVVLALACGVALASTPESEVELVFTQRAMRSVELPLGEWKARAGSLGEAPGREGGPALSLAADGASPAEAAQELDFAALEPGASTLSVSAWVWSDTAGSAHIRLSAQGREALSALHSGGSRWEYLTVVWPHEARPARLGVGLVVRGGAARFAAAKALATFDDRFAKPLPDACNPLRERVTYTRDARVRIVIVGGSTVNGHAVADKRATFPYLLQLKLEAAYPGRFDVMNFGLCGWHLPPQIMTLDKTYNSNKACDGAAWCGGKEAQFSHRNAFTLERNADRNTPTIAQLRPDVIVFAGMWNDAWRVLKYGAWGIPPNPDETRREGDVPASVAYMATLLDYIDHPTEAGYQAADRQFEAAVRPLAAETVAALRFTDHASLRASAEFARLVENARAKLGFLSEAFLRRAARHAQAWTLVLPGRFGDGYEHAARRLQAAGVLEPGAVEGFLMNAYVDAVTEKIQNDRFIAASRKLGVPAVNLSEEYRREHDGMSVSEQLALGYFLANVEDNVHFTYRGNQWLADRLFTGFHEQLERLAKEAPRVR